MTMMTTEGFEGASWYVDIGKVRTDYPLIEDLDQYLVKEVPYLPKYHPEYVRFWSRETKRCIEGKWGRMFGKWRYMPGNLYFFGNYGVIEDTKVIDGVPVTRHFKPRIVDYFWEFAAMSWAAYGFSGFEKDDRETCFRGVLEYEAGSLSKEELPESCIARDGSVKRYVDAMEYLLKLHDEPLGKSMFLNEARDVIVMGSRCLEGNHVCITPEGAVPVREMSPGMRVYNHVGELVDVVDVVRNEEQPCVELSFYDGTSMVCSEDHVWPLKREDSSLEFVGALQLKRRVEEGRLCLVPYGDAVPFERQNLPFDPWLVGALAVAGNIKKNGVEVVLEDEQLTEVLKECLMGANYKIRKTRRLGKEVVVVDIADSMLKMYCETTGLEAMSGIPWRYLHSSIGDRKRLLSAMVDVAARVSRNKAVFPGVAERFCRDVKYLVHSLGWRAAHAGNRLEVHMAENLATLARKRVKYLRMGNEGTVLVTGVRQVGPRETWCLEVRGRDDIFLTDNFMATHNSGGKSYWVGIGELEYNFVFSGARRYDKLFIENKLKCRQVVGSADTTKSAELYDKFMQSQRAKTNNKDSDYVKWFGVYTEYYYDTKGEKRERITPCPFFRHTVGNLDCPNKLNPLKAVYKIKRNGDFQKEGAGSEMLHVNYSTKKGDGEQAAVGGRYLFSNVEEVGLVANYIGVLGSNKSALRRNGRKNGVSWSQGTSGNIEFVQEAKKVFMNPEDYDTLAFDNKIDGTGRGQKTGYFIPNYMVHFAYKDKDGNTNYVEAIGKINKERKKSAESKDPNVLRDHLMNEPCYIDEMWITSKGYYLPVEELMLREKQLMQNDHYRTLETCVSLVWDSTKPRGVRYEVLHDAEPYRHFPHDAAKMKNPQGCVVIYDFPQEINGVVPPDMYRFIGHDPHGDGADPDSSIASTYVMMNPKYAGSPYNLKGNTIVAAYNGKPKGGLDEYYETQEKLLSFYGNPPMSLMYEKNKGEACRGHYIKKHKIHLLSPTPQFGQGAAMTYKQVREFGYFTGSSNFGKSNMAKYIHDWLLEVTELQDGPKQNWERIPCLYLVRQMIQYDLEGNYDAVDGFRGCVLGLREYQIQQESEVKKQKTVPSAYISILNNHRIFKK